MIDLKVNPNCEETHATFRVMGDDLDPDAVTELLQLQPAFARRKGDEYGRPERPIRSRTGIWALESKGAVGGKSLEAHLAYLLGQLAHQEEELRRYVRQRGLEMDISCFWMSATGQGGPVLSADILARLGRLGAMLSFDLYSAA